MKFKHGQKVIITECCSVSCTCNVNNPLFKEGQVVLFHSETLKSTLKYTVFVEGPALSLEEYVHKIQPYNKLTEILYGKI